MRKQKKIVVGNWKMNIVTFDEARALVSSTRRVAEKASKTSVIVCPPAVFLRDLALRKSKSLVFGAQNVFYEQEGSFTGEISADMVRNAGAAYVILGHSERRALGETDADVAKKIEAALFAGLKPIICVGESTRDDHGGYLSFVRDQLKNTLRLVTKKDIGNIIVAYEPVWAIGAVEAMRTPDIREMVIFIQKNMVDMWVMPKASEVPILYGGSVDAKNAREIVLDGGVAGLLIGRASAQAHQFADIIRSLNEL